MHCCTAYQTTQQAHEIPQQLGNQSIEAIILTAMGRSLEGQGEIEDASVAQQKTRSFRLETGQERPMIANTANLALLTLAHRIVAFIK